jgi:hypothetical protein|tara:strand:+ start:339 stop:518 length:180 start_codon:yes stop_codon:yes gene_type:complete
MIKKAIVKLSEISSDPTMRLDARYWIQQKLLKERRKNGSRKTSMDRSTKVQKQKWTTKS